MDARLMFPSKYLKARDIPREGLDATIGTVQEGSLPDARTHESKTVYSLIFSDGVKPLTLNRTNQKIMIAKFGWNTDNWIGKTVHLMRTLGQSFGKMKWLVVIEPPDNYTGEEEEDDLGEE